MFGDLTQNFKFIMLLFLVIFIAFLSFCHFEGGSCDRVLVIGANGRVGRATVRNLLQQGIAVRALVRKTFPTETMPFGSNVEVMVGDVTNLESVKKATSGNISAVIDVHGMSPPRLTKVSDLWKPIIEDKTHPYNVNYIGTRNLLESIKMNPAIGKYIRITGALVGKNPFSNVFIPLFNLILSFSSKWHERSEILIRESGVPYTVIRPTGIKDEPTANENGKTLLMVQGDDPSARVPIPGSISCRDLGRLCSLTASNPSVLENCTVVVSTTKGAPKSWEELIPFIKKDFKVMKPSPHKAAVAILLATIASLVTVIVTGITATISFLATKFFKM